MENTRRTIRELLGKITHGMPYSPLSKASDENDLHRSTEPCQQAFLQF